MIVYYRQIKNYNMDYENKILNPLTNRYVLKTGKIGIELSKNIPKIIVKEIKCTDDKIKECNAKKKICNIETGRCISKLKEKIEIIEDVVKRININDLKKEWKKLYEIAQSSPIFDIIESKDNLLNIKLSKTAKIIGLSGEGTLILRKIKDIALANKELTEIYLPKNYTGKHYANPLYNRVHGYMYYINETNYTRISRIVNTINLINQKYNSYKLLESFNDEEKEIKTHGIIGIDILYVEPSWVTELVKGNPLQNPILNKEGQIIFSKCAITTNTIEKANIYLQQKMPKEFKILYPKYIILSSTKTISVQLKTFIESDYKIANIGYSKHARIIFKKNGNLFIIDPWKQEPDKGTKDLMKLISNLQFIKRKPEQTTEGSCTAVSYARTLHMVMNGVDNINDKLSFDYIILASRLISKYRR